MQVLFRFSWLGCVALTVLFIFLTWSTLTVQREVKTVSDKEVQRLESQFASSTDCIIPRTKDSFTPRGTKKGERACNLGYVLQRGECVQCPPGKFSLPNWIACQTLLNCETVQHELSVQELLHSLVHWQYYRGDWKGYEVIYATFNSLALTMINYSAIQSFPPSQSILYPIGFCREKNVILFASNWTFIEVGNHFEAAFIRNPLCKHCVVKLNLAMSYLRVLVRLHAADTVLCNSYTLRHLLSQFLITDGFSLVLATLDNLRQDSNAPILCKQRELRSNFTAPEQRWPYGKTKIFNPDEQPKYDRTTDIWKVPDVVSVFLQSCVEVMDYLELIHQQCRSHDPHLRPTAARVLEEYQIVWELLLSDDLFL